MKSGIEWERVTARPQPEIPGFRIKKNGKHSLFEKLLLNLHTEIG